MLDYVYELPPDMSSSRKADSLIYALRDRLQIWTSIRKVRVPKRTEEAFAALKKMNAGQVHSEIYDAWQTNMNMQGGAAQLEPSQFGMPPLNSMYSMSESGSNSNAHTNFGSPETMAQNDMPTMAGPVGDSQMLGADDLWVSVRSGQSGERRLTFHRPAGTRFLCLTRAISAWRVCLI